MQNDPDDDIMFWPEYVLGDDIYDGIPPNLRGHHYHE